MVSHISSYDGENFYTKKPFPDQYFEALDYDVGRDSFLGDRVYHHLFRQKNYDFDRCRSGEIDDGAGPGEYMHDPHQLKHEHKQSGEITTCFTT